MLPKLIRPSSPALVDITLSIENGQFVFLTGPSGAGKTTLLKLLFREEEPSEGQILIDHQNVTRLHTPRSRSPTEAHRACLSRIQIVTAAHA